MKKRKVSKVVDKLETSVNEYFGGSSGEVSVTDTTVTINWSPEEAAGVCLAIAAGTQHHKRAQCNRESTTLKSHLEKINTVQLVFKRTKTKTQTDQKGFKRLKMSCSVLGRLFRRRESR